MVEGLGVREEGVGLIEVFLDNRVSVKWQITCVKILALFRTGL